MRVTRVMIFAQTNLMQQLHHPVAFGFAFGELVDFQPFADDIADAHARIERSIGILENNLHLAARVAQDRKSTRLNSSHVAISYAVFCLKKKNQQNTSRTNIRKPVGKPVRQPVWRGEACDAASRTAARSSLSWKQ